MINWSTLLSQCTQTHAFNKFTLINRLLLCNLMSSWRYNILFCLLDKFILHLLLLFFFQCLILKTTNVCYFDLHGLKRSIKSRANRRTISISVLRSFFETRKKNTFQISNDKKRNDSRWRDPSDEHIRVWIELPERKLFASRRLTLRNAIHS